MRPRSHQRTGARRPSAGASQPDGPTWRRALTRASGAGRRRRRPSGLAAAGSSGLPRATAGLAGNVSLGSRANSGRAGQEALDLPLVLLRLERAGGIEQQAARAPRVGGRPREQLALQPGERRRAPRASPAAARRDGGRSCRCRGRARRAAPPPPGGPAAARTSATTACSRPLPARRRFSASRRTRGRLTSAAITRARAAAERDRLAAGRRARVVQRGARRQVGVPREQRLGRVLHHERRPRRTRAGPAAAGDR